MSETVKNIIDNILDNNYVDAENDIHGLLNAKISDAFENIKTSMGSEYMGDDSEFALEESYDDDEDEDEDDEDDDDEDDEDDDDDDDKKSKSGKSKKKTENK